MKALLPCAALALSALLPSCVAYHVPTMGAETQVSLGRDDVELLSDASGTATSFGIFPFWLGAPASQRAMADAMYRATAAAYENAGADFVLQPRTKTTYYNFLLFDYATAEVVGKGVKIRTTR